MLNNFTAKNLPWKYATYHRLDDVRCSYVCRPGCLGNQKDKQTSHLKAVGPIIYKSPAKKIHKQPFLLQEVLHDI